MNVNIIVSLSQAYHPKKYVFFLLFHKYLFSTCYVPGTIPTAGDSSVDQTSDKDRKKQIYKIMVNLVPVP